MPSIRLIGVKMVIFVPLVHIKASCHAHSICITGTSVISIYIRSHIHIAARSQNISYDQKQFISDYICHHALDACYYHCLSVVITFLFLSHFTLKNACLECMGSNFISHQNNQDVWLIWWHELCFGKMMKLWFYHLNNIWQGVQILKHLIIYVSQASSFSLHLRSKYLPAHSILKHSLIVFFA